jgi:hypothetical protein
MSGAVLSLPLCVDGVDSDVLLMLSIILINHWLYSQGSEVRAECNVGGVHFHWAERYFGCFPAFELSDTRIFQWTVIRYQILTDASASEWFNVTNCTNRISRINVNAREGAFWFFPRLIHLWTNHFIPWILFACARLRCHRSMMKGIVTWWSKYILGCISASIWGIFMKLHTTQSPLIRYKHYRLRCHLSMMKGIVTWRSKYILGCISASIWGNFMKLRTTQSPRMRYKWRDFGSDRSQIKGRSVGEQSTFSAVRWLSWQGFFWNFISRTFHSCGSSSAAVVEIGQ